MFRGHRPIFGCIDHSSLPRKLPSSGRRRSERRGTLKGVPSMKFRNGKPERLAVAFRGGFKLPPPRGQIERTWPPPGPAGGKGGPPPPPPDRPRPLARGGEPPKKGAGGDFTPPAG